MLEFEDVVRKIEGSTRRIREQAAVAHQAETRFVSNMMSEMRMEVKSLRRARAEQGPEFTPENIHAILSKWCFLQCRSRLSVLTRRDRYRILQATCKITQLSLYPGENGTILSLHPIQT